MLIVVGCSAKPEPQGPLDAGPGPLDAGSADAGPVDAGAPPDCGPPIEGVELLSDAGLVMLGEIHGTVELPAFVADLTCRVASSGRPVRLGIELDADEQPQIDAFLASAGTPSDRAALVDGG